MNTFHTSSHTNPCDLFLTDKEKNMNLNEIRSAIMGILSGNPKDEPMHYGEVFATWTNLFTNNG